jgi:PAS domain-containing protein
MASTRSELDEFLLRLQDSRSRLDARAPSGDVERQGDVAELGEELLVAEEQLRVQHEELAAVRLEMNHVLVRTAELFGAASTAYAITDVQGLIIDATPVAWQLFGTAHKRTRRSIESMFPTRHRRRVRSLVSLAGQDCAGLSAELALVRGDQEVAVEVSVDLRTEARSGTSLLHWQLTPDVEGEKRPLPRLFTAASSGRGTLSPRPAEDPDGELTRLLSLARADLATELSPERDSDFLLERLVLLTLRWIPGTEHASVTRHADGRDVRSVAATDAVAARCDELQARCRQGPAVGVVVDHDTIRVDDLRQDSRWRAFSAGAADLGVRSVLACELPITGSGEARLNLYSSQPRAFGPMAELVAPVFAARASITLAHSDEVHNLRKAIASRQVIGQAVGILMERHRIRAEEAFDRLVAASKNSRVKLRELAVRITETGEEPHQIRQ